MKTRTAKWSFALFQSDGTYERSRRADCLEVGRDRTLAILKGCDIIRRPSPDGVDYDAGTRLVKIVTSGLRPISGVTSHLFFFFNPPCSQALAIIRLPRA